MIVISGELGLWDPGLSYTFKWLGRCSPRVIFYILMALDFGVSEQKQLCHLFDSLTLKL